MGDVYPELAAKAGYIREVTETEEQRFLETIEGGLRRLEEIFASGARDHPRRGGVQALRHVRLPDRPDRDHRRGARRRGGSRRASSGRSRSSGSARAPRGPAGRRPAARRCTRRRPAKWRSVKRGKQKFVGYQTTEADTDILAFRQEGPRVELVLRENPFYAESGGQVSDVGGVAGPGWSLPVDAVRKDRQGHRGGRHLRARLRARHGRAAVDAPRRHDIERNHSATHLVHYALRKHLGTHVRQQGSLVEPERLRFDFSHHGPIDAGHAAAPSSRTSTSRCWPTSRSSRARWPTPTRSRSARWRSSREKYGDRVRVVQMGPSIELCGGTHVRTTGQVGAFRFSGQSGVAAGVRRIEAVTGRGRAPRRARAGTAAGAGGRRAQGAARAPGAAGRAAARGAAEARGPAGGGAPVRRRRRASRARQRGEWRAA